MVAVCVLCGGFGTRLSSVIGTLPKCLAPIRGVPLLDIQLSQLIKAGFTDITVATGYGHDQVTTHIRSGRFSGIRISREPKPLGTGGALRWVYRMGTSAELILVLNGDTVTSVDYHALITWHRIWQALVTMAVQRRDVMDEPVPSSEEVSVAEHKIRSPTHSGRVVNTSDPGHPYRRTGVDLFSPHALDVVEIGDTADRERDILQALRAGGASLWAYGEHVDFHDIGTPERYRDAQDRIPQLVERQTTQEVGRRRSQ